MAFIAIHRLELHGDAEPIENPACPGANLSASSLIIVTRSLVATPFRQRNWSSRAITSKTPSAPWSVSTLAGQPGFDDQPHGLLPAFDTDQRCNLLACVKAAAGACWQARSRRNLPPDRSTSTSPLNGVTRMHVMWAP